MIHNIWHYFLYLYGLFLDSLSVCDNNNRLSTLSINKTQFPSQYLGRWYFLAAAAIPGTTALETFTVMDNAEFSVRQCREEEKLDFRAAIRIKDGPCVPRKWIYLLPEGSIELRTEGHPDRLTQLFPPRCPHCVILKETDNSYARLLLYCMYKGFSFAGFNSLQKKQLTSYIKIAESILLLFDSLHSGLAHLSAFRYWHCR
ncbi:hypothetical protein XELAEV_18039185mg [Xenopus laevis]|uniref:Apolipoprotein M n=1 Tax=Xenopus laevis TaxID=8355 RepID=A0A974C799_XENLA|nr:hypothetical protein XELAEV_18039185mg [Xenopus laevis]